MTDIRRGDYHVHSTFSDDAVSTIAENIAAASARGLTTLRLIDHVRASTTWVPQFVAAVAAEPVPDGLTVLTGVETKLMDSRGTLDLPAELDGIDVVVIADHQYPGPDGPWSPTETIARLAAGADRELVLDQLIAGLVAAMTRYPGNQLAHCFSILPKVGLSEDDLGEARLRVWAETAAATGTLVEINEKWRCPGPLAQHAARAAGVRLVAASDAHVATDVGVYSFVAEAAS